MHAQKSQEVEAQAQWHLTCIPRNVSGLGSSRTSTVAHTAREEITDSAGLVRHEAAAKEPSPSWQKAWEARGARSIRFTNANGALMFDVVEGWYNLHRHHRALEYPFPVSSERQMDSAGA